LIYKKAKSSIAAYSIQSSNHFIIKDWRTPAC